MIPSFLFNYILQEIPGAVGFTQCAIFAKILLTINMRWHIQINISLVKNVSYQNDGRALICFEKTSETDKYLAENQLIPYDNESDHHWLELTNLLNNHLSPNRLWYKDSYFVIYFKGYWGSLFTQCAMFAKILFTIRRRWHIHINNSLVENVSYQNDFRVLICLEKTSETDE